MKKRRVMKENLVSVLEIPSDLAYRDVIVTLNGNRQVNIENYRSILSYTEEEIILLTFQGKLQISGKKLKIPIYSADEMKISGFISGISYTK